MAGAGGFRKLRFARQGMGKSGGARVIYIYHNEKFPVFLVTVFAKNRKDNLTKRSATHSLSELNNCLKHIEDEGSLVI